MPRNEVLPYQFTGKELDRETGLYYYGARYLDLRASRRLSADPAAGEYVPAAAAGRRGGNLPGMSGICNAVNLRLYHYAGNNPVKYTDPDGRIDIGALMNLYNASQNGDIVKTNFWNNFFNSKDPKAEFKHFMNFIGKQGVERSNFDDPYIHEKIVDSWDNLPESIKNYKTGNIYKDIASRLGDHNKNLRLSGGYHLTEEDDGKVYVHHDKIDPLNSITNAVLHKGMEVTFSEDDRPVNQVDNKPDWAND